MCWCLIVWLGCTCACGLRAVLVRLISAVLVCDCGCVGVLYCGLFVVCACCAGFSLQLGCLIVWVFVVSLAC